MSRLLAGGRFGGETLTFCPRGRLSGPLGSFGVRPLLPPLLLGRDALLPSGALASKDVLKGLRSLQGTLGQLDMMRIDTCHAAQSGEVRGDLDVRLHGLVLRDLSHGIRVRHGKRHA